MADITISKNRVLIKHYHTEMSDNFARNKFIIEQKVCNTLRVYFLTNCFRHLRSIFHAIEYAV